MKWKELVWKFKKRLTKYDYLNDDKLEYSIYSQEIEKSLKLLEKHLHTSDDPEEIAMLTLKTVCDFYQGDWAGMIEADLDLNIWTPFWWYNVKDEDKTDVLMKEYESSEYLYRWVDALKKNYAIIVENAEDVKEICAEEYSIYQRLGVHSLMAVPVKPRPTGFLVVRNPKRYLHRSSMLQMLAFVALTTVNEKKSSDSSKRILSPERIQSDKDVIINLFGKLEIYTSKGVLKEDDFKSPKICRLVVYLLLNREKTHPPMEIIEELWPTEDASSDALCNNLRGIIYRFRQFFSLISEYQLIESTPNGYRLNPELHIMTDLQQFDKNLDEVALVEGTSRKVQLLKQTLAIYRGHVFESARSEHWLATTADHYSAQYLALVNRLLEKLAEAGDYLGVNKYAAQSLDIMVGKKTYYWFIYSTYQLGAGEMAKRELERAKNDLIEEEYEELLKMLKK